MSTQRRRVLENAGIHDGVYIEGLDGKAYTVDEWQGGSAANSIIVASGNVKFRFSHKQPAGLMISGSDYDPLENYMTAITDETAAKTDYDGAGNTAKIMQMQPSTDYAAGYCNAFIFPDGKTKGYLPSLGQLWLVYQNKAAVDAAISKCNGDAMYIGYNKTSTFRGIDSFDARSRMCWSLHWGDGDLGGSYLHSRSYFRPFADLT